MVEIVAIHVQGSPHHHTDGVAIAIVGAVFAVCALVTVLKGKWGIFALGIVISLLWPIGAIRLAKPESWWARRFYKPEKLALAMQRFHPPPVAPASAAEPADEGPAPPPATPSSF